MYKSRLKLLGINKFVKCLNIWYFWIFYLTTNFTKEIFGAKKNVFKSGKMNDKKLEGFHADNVSFNLTESMVSLIETTGSREGLLRNFLSLLTTSSRDPELINCYIFFPYQWLLEY